MFVDSRHLLLRKQLIFIILLFFSVKYQLLSCVVTFVYNKKNRTKRQHFSFIIGVLHETVGIDYPVNG
jgi:hypothetical protein